MTLTRLSLQILFCFLGASLAEDILTSPMVTNWGEWGPWEHCPEGTKVIGFQLKTETWHAWNAVVDDTCLNAIKFYCGHPSKSGPGTVVEEITSAEGFWGKWGEIFFCDGLGFARGFTLRSEEANTAAVDETATNNLRILCSQGTQFIEGDGERWGQWTSPRICKESQYICGLQTQVEGPKGVSEDDTALNNIRVKCCDLSIDELRELEAYNATVTAVPQN